MKKLVLIFIALCAQHAHAAEDSSFDWDLLDSVQQLTRFETDFVSEIIKTDHEQLEQEMKNAQKSSTLLGITAYSITEKYKKNKRKRDKEFDESREQRGIKVLKHSYE